MSLTLPYPGMVFVPLDILTAEEQNQIVANYQFIADQFPIESENIDFTTITDEPSQMSLKTATQELGYGLSGTITRIGYTVQLDILGQFTNLPPIAWQTLGETIPEGYRPSRDIVVVISGVSGDNNPPAVSWKIKTGGGMEISKQGLTNLGWWIQGTVTWITTNDWPS